MIIMLFLSIILSLAVRSKSVPVQELVCTTPACADAAGRILQNMNPEVKPCEDFYQFACGKFVKETEIPDNKLEINQFRIVADKLQEQLIESIKSEIDVAEPQAIMKMKQYYNACTNLTQRNDTSEKELRKILKELGGWPIYDEETLEKSSFNWKNLVYKLNSMGYSPGSFVDVSVEIDNKNSSRYVVNIHQPDLEELFVPASYLAKGLENIQVFSLYSFMIESSKVFGADRNKVEEVLLELFEFLTELAKIRIPRGSSNSESYHSIVLQEFESKYPVIPWKEYINQVLAPHAHLDSNETIIVSKPEYFESLQKLLSKTSKRTIANYILSRVFMESVRTLGENMQMVIRKYYALGSKSHECYMEINKHFSIALSSIYVRKYFDKSGKENVIEMIENIRDRFRRLLDQANWMAEETKEEALEKLNLIVSYVAYPDELLDDRIIDEHYKDLVVYPDNYLKTLLSLKSFKNKLHFERLRKPVNKKDWKNKSDSAKANAAYNIADNTIKILAGILQDPFFNNSRPNYMNYGGIGFVIGHELTHAFDVKGSQYDSKGNLRDWWDLETKEEYQKRTECMVEQYGNYTVKTSNGTMHLDGYITLGENIADNGGIKEAYQAYNEWVKQNGQEPGLPGLPYSPKQLFWISAANIYCSKVNDKYLEDIIPNYVHSLGEFRVKGAFSNQPEFLRDFDCHKGSKMNPERKCIIW